MKILVTGGAGFIGANVAIHLAANTNHEIIALDNLRRRGSALNLERLRNGGVEFRHGDVRVWDDLDGIKASAIVECSAEPSVMGVGEYVVQTNLLGAHNCIQLARENCAQIVFLSTSRVYPIQRLREQHYETTDTRFEWYFIPNGWSESYVMEGARTLYGATKYAAEILLAEYNGPKVINRCGVVAGPWQMGKVDQGIFAYWMLAHYYGRKLTYMGYGGRQVRDILHVQDLAELILLQIEAPKHWNNAIVNVGGGRENSLSLLEASQICREITCRDEMEYDFDPVVREGDVPIYISDCTKLFNLTHWRPQYNPRETLVDIYNWINSYQPDII